jgi:hypothetical protein
MPKIDAAARARSRRIGLVYRDFKKSPAGAGRRSAQP